MRIPEIWPDFHGRRWKFKELEGRMTAATIEEQRIYFIGDSIVVGQFHTFKHHTSQYKSAEKMWADISSWARTASTVGAKRK